MDVKPEPEFLVALALSGVLSEEQTVQILRSVRFTANTMTLLRSANALNRVCDLFRDDLWVLTHCKDTVAE